ncbi:MAG: nucleotide exchange factor GrpE [Candidatus Marinimicrobia bacterium]|nr:nucleotide exchange factor GrpE [Candidatus Neomarinimicrobiota bacterium]MBL7022653.1 nucleotide exchange factor GrpE [Candidatus Neomarinimicrobiota bacterium]MBL7109923.1 nucleotide exchange factor GrpE [Candidatus Neomarinimicrobiota bacterium]
MTVKKSNKDTKSKVKNNLKSKKSKDSISIKKIEKKNKDTHDKLNLLTKDRDLLKEKNVRLLAEFDNYKRRTINEKSDLLKYAAQKLVKDILPIMDDLQRTIESTSNSKDLNKLLDGIKLVKEKFEITLTKNDIVGFKSKGEKFDAELHDALMSKETEEEDGIILEEFEKGYKYHDKIIRHAKVIVNKAIVNK